MSARTWYRHGWTGTEKETEMADTHARDNKADLKPNPKTAVNPNIADPEDAPKPTPEEAKAKAEAKSKHDAAVDKTAKANSKLAKDGNSHRLEVNMRNGEPKFFWVSTYPTRELTPDELKAAVEMRA
jgi:hypothetical protein